MRTARILIAGAGALGSLYGAFLRRAGHDVTLLGRRPHLEAIRERGLRFDGVFGEGVASDFALADSPGGVDGPFDLIVLAVKAYDIESAARPLVTQLARDGALLALQNGLGHLEVLSELFGGARVLAAPVLIGATIPEPGRVSVTVYAKPVKIGSPSPAGLPLARSSAVRLAAAGIPSEPTDRLLASLWEKMLYNVALNALGAVLRVRYGALGERAETREIMDALIDEGFAVARAEDADLLWSDAAACRRHFYESLLPPTAAHRSSMLQDIERRRPTEIAALNGYVVRRAAALGIAAPRNLVVTGLVRATEARAEAPPR